jgi:hypothetical protein
VSVTAPVFGKIVGVRTLGQIVSREAVDPYKDKPAVVTTPMRGAAKTTSTSSK